MLHADDAGHGFFNAVVPVGTELIKSECVGRCDAARGRTGRNIPEYGMPLLVCTPGSCRPFTLSGSSFRPPYAYVTRHAVPAAPAVAAENNYPVPSEATIKRAHERVVAFFKKHLQ